MGTTALMLPTTKRRRWSIRILIDTFLEEVPAKGLAAVFGTVTDRRWHMEGDFEPEGWSAFDDMSGGGKGSAGCGCFFLVVFVIGILAKLLFK